MVNLPSGIIETPPREFEWLLEKIDDIYNKKLEADNTDRNDGLRLQPLGEFVIEQLLFNHGLRRLAEVHLFDLLASLKHHLRKKHPKMVIFARFLDAYYSTKTPEKLDNINILQVYLIVRDQLLHITKNIVNEDKQDQDGQQVDQKLLHQDGQTYIPIEHAVVTMRYTYLSFLPPRKASLYVKTIESMAGVQAIFTSPDGKVVQEFRPPNKASTGDRMTVRIAMRNAMLTKIDAEEEEPAPKKKKGKKGRKEKPIEPEPEEAGVQKQVFVDMDLVLGKLIKVLISRERYIEEKLKQMFIEGDTDGDGVLSFAEFQDITAQGNSDLSQRKILRMFREAVTRGGPEASLSLLPETFQAVGKDYDLIPLCDMEKLRRVTVSRQSQRSDKQ
uniref:EF-hand domain-containing protein n=1 Tax=Mucochytrium quahogii TaxID=96639 RepID=A0A7S2SBJ9_9STRA|mmetsp:Transcript_354/g.803  ORF Transcript_354/g.803 Transcript_354/m.803 type:complete len:387 (+) Transcript_354:1-1161(+)